MQSTLNKLFTAITLLATLQACVPELHEVEIDYFIGIKGVSETVVKVDDTIEVFIDWINSPVTQELSLAFDGIPSKTLGLKNDSVLIVISPSGWEAGELQLSHPNGAQCTWQGLQKNNHPQVKLVSTFKGVADDVVSISGKEFTASVKTAITINNHLCEIVEMLDTIIKFKVPDSCGSGLLKMHYWTTSPENCTADKTFELGRFDYDLELQPQRKVKAYSAYYDHYLLERDASGKVNKRIHLDENGQATDRSDDLIYNADGLLESITCFESGTRYKYITYTREQSGQLLKVSTYNDDNQLQSRHQYTYSNDKIIDYSYYMQLDEVYSIKLKYEFEYTDNKVFITQTEYFSDGTIKQQQKFENVEFDVYNRVWPDLGILGFEKLHEYPLTRLGDIKFKTFYNQQGELVKIERQEACEEISTAYKFEYEEN
jgi:antitoxin component YwqK of YwqJK toxin-antitoxin module